MLHNGGLKLEVADGFGEVRLGAYRASGNTLNAETRTGTAVYGPVCTVVWGDGSRLFYLEPPTRLPQLTY